jgi:starch phosphorylase
MRVGQDVELSATVQLGGLKPDEVTVEIYHGAMSTTGSITGATRTRMELAGAGEGKGQHRYAATIPMNRTGRQGLSVRVLPRHAELVGDLVPGFVAWG